MIAAVVVPVMVGFGTISIGNGYYGYRRLLLQQTVQNSALAAGNKLSTYYSSGGSSSAIVTAAQTFATANMPSAKFGTVVTSANVVLGNLSGTTFTSLASSGGTTPNAVQVTGLNTSANGNPVPLSLGNWFGKPNVDMTIKVTASYATGQAFNTIFINDMSGSFSNELSNQRAADLAILNCVRGQTGTTSQYGITLANGHSTTYQPLVVAGTNYATLQTKISNLDSGDCNSNCGTGSNMASGLYSAIQQFSDATFANTRKNILLITDGVPNADSSVDYEQADGIYPTPSTVTPTCKGKNKCTDDNLLTMAKNQATVAGTAGISISTIYYSGNTNISDQAGYSASVGSLVTGTGVAMVAPTTSMISATIAGFCATMPSALKVVM